MWYLLILLIVILVCLQVLKRRQQRAHQLTPLGAAQHPASKRAYASVLRLSKSKKLFIHTRPNYCRQQRSQEIQHALKHCDYSTAEALLNRAIHLDPGHEKLYLDLLELHLAQGNELALEKLFQHIQQLDQEQLFKKAYDRYVAVLGHAPNYTAPLAQRHEKFVGPLPQTHQPQPSSQNSLNS